MGSFFTWVENFRCLFLSDVTTDALTERRKSNAFKEKKMLHENLGVVTASMVSMAHLKEKTFFIHSLRFQIQQFFLTE